MKQFKTLPYKKTKKQFVLSVSRSSPYRIKIDHIKMGRISRYKPIKPVCSKAFNIETIDWGGFPPGIKREIIRVRSSQQVIAIKKSIAIYNSQYKRNKIIYNEKYE